jgi:hypothetical protein
MIYINLYKSLKVTIIGSKFELKKIHQIIKIYLQLKANQRNFENYFLIIMIALSFCVNTTNQTVCKVKNKHNRN